MNPTQEQLLHAFYNCDQAALVRLAQILNPALAMIAFEILQVRTGSAIQARIEWNVDEWIARVWEHIVATKTTMLAIWPSQRLSAFTWIVHLLCLEMDRHLMPSGPF
jgi:hypothetical protein